MDICNFTKTPTMDPFLVAFPPTSVSWKTDWKPTRSKRGIQRGQDSQLQE